MNTTRIERLGALTGMLAITTDPETQQVLQAMAMMNMEGEGIWEVRDYFRTKLVQMGVIEPTEEEAAEMMAAMQNQQPDPQSLYLQAEATKAQAQAVKAQADTEYAVARAEETRAKTIETLASVENDQRESAVKTAKNLQDIVQGANEMRQPPSRF